MVLTNFKSIICCVVYTLILNDSTETKALLGEANAPPPTHHLKCSPDTHYVLCMYILHVYLYE